MKRTASVSTEVDPVETISAPSGPREFKQTPPDPYKTMKGDKGRRDTEKTCIFHLGLIFHLKDSINVLGLKHMQKEYPRVQVL